MPLRLALLIFAHRALCAAAIRLRPATLIPPRLRCFPEIEPMPWSAFIAESIRARSASSCFTTAVRFVMRGILPLRGQGRCVEQTAAVVSSRIARHETRKGLTRLERSAFRADRAEGVDGAHVRDGGSGARSVQDAPRDER